SPRTASSRCPARSRCDSSAERWAIPCCSGRARCWPSRATSRWWTSGSSPAALRSSERIASLECPMLVHVTQAQHRGGHRVWLRFNDGVEGEIDLSNALRGPVFQPLTDPEFFARFQVDDTLVWPNGADYAPEFLYERVLEVRRDSR